MPSPVVPALLPPRPDLVFRVGFAGNITLPVDDAPRRAALDKLLQVIAQQLAGLVGNVPARNAKLTITHYYSPTRPLLRLVTGLAEGADTEAADALKRLELAQQEQLPRRMVRTELAAVLGCDVPAYRDSRDPAHRPVFDAMVQACSYVLALDGRYVGGEAGRAQRARLYRAQATFLLRHADLLVALATPESEGKAGGTLETVRQALTAGLGVVFIHAETGEIRFLRPEDDLLLLDSPEAFGAGGVTRPWREQVRAWVNETVVGPNQPSTAATPQPAEDLTILDEYFDAERTPRYEGQDRQVSLLEGCWRWFEGQFKHERPLWQRLRLRWPGGTRPAPAPSPVAAVGQGGIPAAYLHYRTRTTALSAHYAGRYRGAFVLNYLLAVLAVLFAASSLVVLGQQQHTTWGDLADKVLHTGAVSPAPTPAPPVGLIVTLAGLGLLKLACLGGIFYNTRRAQKGKWNDRAVEYRYLAERLRSLYYLPQLGSYRPPPILPHYGSRAARQSAVEWLFKAVVRAGPPVAVPCELAVATGQLRIRLVTIDAAASLTYIEQDWIRAQARYHEENARKMAAMNRFLERASKWLNGVVIGFVVGDLLGLLGTQWPWLRTALPLLAPWLVFLTTVLPAAVVSLGGIRFQSECQRLADRSAFVRTFLAGRQQQAHALRTSMEAAQAAGANPGAWNAAVLRLGEAVANDLGQEVAEWSVIYAKELTEP